MSLVTIKPLWFVALFLIGSAEEARLHRIVEQSADVHVGMSPREVDSILGSPDGSAKADDFWQLAFLGFNSGQWYWGSAVNLDSILIPEMPMLNPLPLNLRILTYADHDLVICWNFEDRVSEIRRPELDVPPLSFAILDTWIFIRELGKVFIFTKA